MSSDDWEKFRFNHTYLMKIELRLLPSLKEARMGHSYLRSLFATSV